MTRNEAIEILKDLADCNYVGSLSGDDREALNVALAFLKTDEAYNLLYEETTKKDLEVEAKDCIPREYTAKYVEEFANNEYVTEDEAETIYLIAEGIRHISTVYPKSDKPSGKWIWNVDITPASPVGAEEINYIGWACSHCHSYPDDYLEWDDIDNPPTYKYCPNCGAKMDGEEQPDDN